MTLDLHLSPAQFQETPRLLATCGAIRVSAFRYPSGVEALRITTPAGEAVALPFRGQQIWDARCGDRRLTMASPFDEPQATTAFLKTYGAYFVHCGATATGSPGPGDSHAPHGELPAIRFETATLGFGHSDGEDWIELSGLAKDQSFFGPSFAFRPRLRLAASRMVFEASVEIENIGATPLPLMYLAHVNVRPVDGSVLIDGLSAAQQPAWAVPASAGGLPAERRAWHEEVAADFGRHREIRAGDHIEKEFGFTAAYPAGADGWAHALQRLPDGSADFVSHRPDQLPVASRWLSRAEDRQSLGLSLPATTRPVGRSAAEKAGQLRWLPRAEVFRAAFRFGALGRAEADALSAIIPRH